MPQLILVIVLIEGCGCRQASRVANLLEELHARITAAVDKYLTPVLLKVQQNLLHTGQNLLCKA
jgi:hypothetical protein